MANDEKLYQQVLDELRTEGPREALWFKSVTECEGDKDRAEFVYVRYRVEQLKAQVARDRLNTIRDAATSTGDAIADVAGLFSTVIGLVLLISSVVMLFAAEDVGEVVWIATAVGGMGGLLALIGWNLLRTKWW